MNCFRLLGAILTTACGAVALANASCASNVIDVYVSLDAEGTRKAEIARDNAGNKLTEFITFESNTRAVYCIAEYSNGDADSTIIGTMHQERVDNPDGTSSVDRDIIVASVNEPAKLGAQQVTAMALLPLDAEGKEDDKMPLAGGVYRCDFALRNTPVPEGTVAAVPVGNQVQFLIKPSSCPPTRILQGEACTFYRDNEPCPQDGALSQKQSPDFQCTCTSGAWVCNQ